MEVKVEKLKQSKVKLIVTLTPAEMVKHFKHAFEHIAPTVNLPGFRPGKAPKKLVESTVGISRILSEGIDLAINDAYINALQKEKIVPLTTPSIKINQYPNYGETEDEVKTSLKFEVEVVTYPAVKVGDYSKIKVELPKREAVQKEDVEKILENLRKQKATFIEVDREAKKGDWAEISFEGSLKGIKIDAMTSKNHPLTLGENTLIPGFEDEIVGMKKGDNKNFKIKFPKDYHAKEYAGKEAEFKVELLNLKEVNLPEVNDTFAADFGMKNADELKKAIEKNLESELHKKYESELEGKVLDKIMPLVKADVPDEMIDKEVERMLTGYQDQLKNMGMNFETYLSSIKKTVDDLKKDMRPTAEKNIKVGLLLGEIIKEKKWDANDPEAGKKAVDHLIKTVTK